MLTSPRPPHRPTLPRPQAADTPNDARAFVQRARVFALVIALLFFGLVARLWFLQIASGPDFRQAADANQARRIRTRAPRGTILDSHGVLLAGNRSRFAVYATPTLLKDTPTLNRLAVLLHDTPADIRETIQEGQQNPYDPLRVALDVPMSVVSQIEENRPFLSGVSTAPEPVRWYPQGDLAAHLLGYMGRINPQEYQRLKAQEARENSDQVYFSDDFLGKTGIESQYEQELHGAPGGTDVQIDARGRRVRVVDTAASTPGGTVTLALDARVQAAAEKVMHDRGFTGAAVAINPQTGGVIAMASAPTFNPGAFATGIKPNVWKPLNTGKAHPLINRTMDAMYPPGSTFKPVVAAAGLQTGAITTHSTVYCSGAYYLGRARFGCWQRHGSTDFYKAIADSCDVFFYIAGRSIGPDRMAAYAKAFGLAEKTGIDLPSEDIGSIPSPDWKQRHFGKYGPQYSTWFGGDTLHMSIGQGDVLVTPLQMARVTATIANGGDVLKPYVVEKIADGATGAVKFQARRTVVRHVPVSAANMESVRRGMRTTTTSGTGRIVNFPQVAVASKTGSAQVHGKAKTHGWFICFAPYDHPTIAVAAVVEQGGHGADSAGRIARAMVQAYFHLPGTPESSARSD